MQFSIAGLEGRNEFFDDPKLSNMSLVLSSLEGVGLREFVENLTH